MLIDWFTLLAQLVNFLILVWLLKRFLYKPILNLIDDRERHISKQLNDAANLKEEATEEKDSFFKKNKEFDLQRQEMYNTAMNEVDAERQKLLNHARIEIDNLRHRLHETFKNDQKNLSNEIARRTRVEVFSIARKTLKDLASVSLEDQLVKVFINRLENLEPAEKESILSAISNIQGVVIVRSAFKLSAVQIELIDQFIRNNFLYEVEIKYSTSSNQVAGIELLAGGYKIGWSIDEYIDSMEYHLSELMTDKA